MPWGFRFSRGATSASERRGSPGLRGQPGIRWGKYFPGEDAIGKRIEPGAANGEKERVREIVGWSETRSRRSLGGSDPIYYFPYKQLSWGIGTIVLRTAVPPLEVSLAVGLQCGTRPGVLNYRMRSGEEPAAAAVRPMRFLTSLMAASPRSRCC